jgi:hypothetical protein
MEPFEKQATQSLFDKKMITDTQYKKVKAYRSLEIFSLNTELKFLLYLSVLAFTTGIGVIPYQNIDSIGHSTILSLLLVVTFVCYYFSFKNSAGFQKGETNFDNPIFDYLILAAILLTCIFIGYLQFQYTTFGTYYGLATLIPTAVGFFCAYYFDNKSILSIAITGLAAYIGLSINPQSLLSTNFYNEDSLSLSAIILGIALVLWSSYSTKIELKKHFSLVFLTFGLHLISLACVSNLFDSYWGIFALLLAGSSYYFYKTSYQIKSVSLYVFTVLYAYVNINILLFKVIDLLNIDEFNIFLSLLVLLYLIFSIVLFIRLIKKFYKNSNYDSIQ